MDLEELVLNRQYRDLSVLYSEVNMTNERYKSTLILVSEQKIVFLSNYESVEWTDNESM